MLETWGAREEVKMQASQKACMGEGRYTIYEGNLRTRKHVGILGFNPSNSPDECK